MVNYKRVVCEGAVLAVLAALLVAAAAAPAHDCKEHDTLYDQRQNGSENYRLNIDGVVVAVAPADSLLSAASDLDFNDLFDLEELEELQKPKPPAHGKPPKPEDSKPEDSKPQNSKPDDSKPQPSKPDESPLSEVTLNNDPPSQKKELPVRKQEKAQRLKNRLANILIPLLRRTRHH